MHVTTESGGASVTRVVWQSAQRTSACSGCENGTVRSRGAAGGVVVFTATVTTVAPGSASSDDAWHCAHRLVAGAW